MRQGQSVERLLNNISTGLERTTGRQIHERSPGDRLVSMSNDKYDAITGSGIEVGERVPIPEALIPADAKVEMEAKIAAGYFTEGKVPTEVELAAVMGRALE